MRDPVGLGQDAAGLFVRDPRHGLRQREPRGIGDLFFLQRKRLRARPSDKVRDRFGDVPAAPNCVVLFGQDLIGNDPDVLDARFFLQFAERGGQGRFARFVMSLRKGPMSRAVTDEQIQTPVRGAADRDDAVGAVFSQRGPP